MLKVENSFLVVIDVQGNLAHSMHNKEPFLAALKIAIQGAQLLNIPVVWAEQLPDKLGVTLPEVAELMPNDTPNEKSSFSVYRDEVIRTKIDGLKRRQALLVGIESHVCVFQSCRDLLNSNYEVHLLSDAIASRAESNREIGLRRAEKLGAELSSTEMALFDLADSPENPAFRELIRLFK